MQFKCIVIAMAQMFSLVVALLLHRNAPAALTQDM